MGNHALIEDYRISFSGVFHYSFHKKVVSELCQTYSDENSCRSPMKDAVDTYAPTLALHYVTSGYALSSSLRLQTLAMQQTEVQDKSVLEIYLV